ncbi:tRNA pseudouridine synthase B [Candidatus Hydrogenisulfobacillus filiaventi]|uniref:tRNA pseudouridine synthase B n=1 Tax=Candidatus Hydrogenisulfobacillus filiaventi TaxID=2707344 RepID=A0A6F8ZFR4_9FIRM|nr:tRNA pseudouridine(55) synthase TruB [Bacillota bacterium]CAB1128774.1 tRNA pseudouridine synthase B [Candidatus Hydrogenisulfobacillus filiaventi]
MTAGPEGILVVRKPAGLTSFAAVREVQRLTGAARAGHAGTLDPAAEGVLPVALGAATRWLPWLKAEPKRYRAEVEFGRATASGDGDGPVVARSGRPWPGPEAVAAALRWLEGPQWQLPPSFSAKKVGGVRAYARARRGRGVFPAPCRVDVQALAARGGGAHWTLEATVSGGTYIRSLVRDLGELLGQAAVLTRLQRTAVGPFRLEQALTLEAVAAGAWREALLGPEAALDLPLIPVETAVVPYLVQGRALAGLPLPPLPAAPAVGLAAGGRLVAIVEGPPGLRYRAVFPPVPAGSP